MHDKSVTEQLNYIEQKQLKKQTLMRMEIHVDSPILLLTSVLKPG